MKTTFKRDFETRYGVSTETKPQNPEIPVRLEYLRRQLREERISYSELHELQSLAEHIDKSDVELLEAAGVPESESSPTRLPEQRLPSNWHDCEVAEKQILDLTLELRQVTAQRDELLAAAKEARMALTMDYHGTTRPKRALCDLSPAASQAHNKIVLAIAKCEAQP